MVISKAHNQSRRRLLEYLIPISVLAILFVYSYARFFLIPYIGFQFSGSSGEVIEIDVDQSVEPFLATSDVILSVNGIAWEDFSESQQENPMLRVKPNELISLQVHGISGDKQIQWKTAGFNMPEFWTRLINTWPLSYAFWLAGTATLLLVRPKNERWTLLIAFYYVTAIWIIAGGVSSWRVLGSSLVLRIGVWASLPIYLQLHWNFPSLIKPIWRGWIYLLYGGVAVLGIAQAFSFLSRNTHAFALVLAILISVFLLLWRLIYRPSERTDVGLLFFATAVALSPLAAIALASGQSSINPVLAGLLFSMLALPGAYFYVVYRKQLGGLELRANRLISAYFFAILLITLVLSLFPLFSAGTAGLENASGAVAGTVLATTLATILGFPPFQSFVERRLLRIPKTSESLLAELAGEVSTGFSYSNLSEVLVNKVLPVLLIRESALVDLEDGESGTLVYQEGVKTDVPVTNLLVNGQLIQPDTNADVHFKWVRLAIPLRIAGSIRGIWLLGKKDPDDYYHQNELTLLNSLADQIAITLANISLVKRLRALHQADIERQEAERIHLARELHDDVLPRINDLSASHTPSRDMQSKIAELNALIRRQMVGLRPPLLDQGLYLALEQLAEDLREKIQGSTTINFKVNSSLDRFDLVVEQHLFRMVQQACENAISHGSPKTVTIRGRIDPTGIDLLVEDDGSGFEIQGGDLTELLRSRHYGLAGMSERAAMIGVSLEIESKIGRGTKVRMGWKPAR